MAVFFISFSTFTELKYCLHFTITILLFELLRLPQNQTLSLNKNNTSNTPNYSKFQRFFIDNKYRLGYYRPSIYPQFILRFKGHLTICLFRVKVGLEKRFLSG